MRPLGDPAASPCIAGVTRPNLNIFDPLHSIPGGPYAYGAVRIQDGIVPSLGCQMHFYSRWIALFAPLIVLAGCSTYPLPQNFARKTTFDIVKLIRCEVANGIRLLGPVGPEEGASILPEELEGTVIGFDFTFTMTEENDATSATIGLTNPVGGGKFLLDVTGGAEKERTNERTFRLIDTMAKLRNEAECSPDEQRANFIYPIAGRIGLEELVDTYWRLRDTSTFTQGETKRYFTDKLLFTTILTAGISPTLEVTSGIADFKLTNASIDGKIVRTDKHQVTVAIVQSVAKKIIKTKTKRIVRRSSDPRIMGAPQVERVETVIEKKAVAVPNPAAATQGVIDELDRQRARDDDRDFSPFRPTR